MHWRSMGWTALGLISAMLLACGAPQKFDESQYSSTGTGATPSMALSASSSGSSARPASTSTAARAANPEVPDAKKYWKKSGKVTLPPARPRVAIVEFTVDYVISRDKKLGGNNLGLMTVARLAGVGRREYQLEESLKTQLPTELYNLFTRELQNRGFDVVAMADTAAAIKDAEMVAGEAGKKKSDQYHHGFLQGGGSQKVQIFPVNGLPRLYDGFFTFGKNYTAMGGVMNQLKADVGLRVHMRLGLHDGKATAEAGSNMIVFTGVNSYQSGKDKTSYAVSNHATLQGKETLYYDVEVIDQKKFEAFKGNVFVVNSNDYTNAVRRFFPAYSAMAISQFK